MKTINLIGRKLGRLTVLSVDHRDANRKLWVKCSCECGSEKVIKAMCIVNGDTRSCGCLHRECVGKLNRKHGESHRTRLYVTWRNMLDRCERSYASGFKSYGEKGISVCEEWHNYAVFAAWARANGYSDSLTIDRKNSSQGYGPSNCQFLTRAENARRPKRNRVAA